jgi:hypothetical protein
MLNVGLEDLSQGQIFLQELEAKNHNLEKALIYANVHYKANGGFDPKPNPSLPSSFKTQTVSSYARATGSGEKFQITDGPKLPLNLSRAQFQANFPSKNYDPTHKKKTKAISMSF